MTEAFTCPIWGTSAKKLGTGNYGDLTVQSPRTDGIYRITATAVSAVKRLPEADKAKLTTWIVDARRAGEEAPLVNQDALDDIAVRRPLRTSERKRRFFELARARDMRPSDFFRVAGVVDGRQTQDRGALAAWTESPSDADCSGLLRLLNEEGLINYAGDAVTLTSEGFERLESIEAGGAPTRQAFVAMWFDASMNEAYSSAIEPAIRDAGYDPVRVDRMEHNNKIDDEIIAAIRRSRFVVADFTCGLVTDGGKRVAIARGGVYFEAGFAWGLGIPVIWTCRADCIDLVHFDTRQYNHIVWNKPAELCIKLTNRIQASIR